MSRRVGMADEADSKSVVGNHVWVQVPSPAVLKSLEKPVKSGDDWMPTDLEASVVYLKAFPHCLFLGL